MLDPALAERVALLVAGGPGPVAPAPGDLTARCAEAEGRVVAATGLSPQAALPVPEWVDRGAWAGANARSLDALLSPLADRVGEGMGPLAGPARGAAGLVATAEAGALLGVMGRRVLGQYDVVLLDATVAPRLLFVGPNLAEVAASVDADLEDLVAWVAFHEVTHAVQFASVGWLRETLAGHLRELLAGLQVRVDPAALARRVNRVDLEELRALAGAVRERGLVGAFAGPDRQAVLDRLQATMALVEGHAEWVMDEVGREALPSLDRLRAALDERRRDRPTALRLLDRLLGLDLKLRQYEEGRRFWDAVAAAGGRDGISVPWRSEADAPSLDELRAPERWLARMAGEPAFA